MRKCIFFLFIFTLSTLTVSAQEDPEFDLRSLENEDIEMRAKSIDFVSENTEVMELVAKASSEIVELKRRNNALDKEIDLIQSKNESLNSINNSLNNQNETLLKEMEIIAASDKNEDYVRDEIIKYNKVIEQNQKKINVNNTIIEKNETMIKKHENSIDENEETIGELEESTEEYKTLIDANHNYNHIKGRKN